VTGGTSGRWRFTGRRPCEGDQSVVCRRMAGTTRSQVERAAAPGGRFRRAGAVRCRRSRAPRRPHARAGTAGPRCRGYQRHIPGTRAAQAPFHPSRAAMNSSEDSTAGRDPRTVDSVNLQQGAAGHRPPEGCRPHRPQIVQEFLRAALLNEITIQGCLSCSVVKVASRTRLEPSAWSPQHSQAYWPRPWP
jgi:hypothetical protein